MIAAKAAIFYFICPKLMEQIISLLNDIKPLHEAVSDFLKQKLKKEQFVRKSFLIQPDLTNKKIYFIEKGIVRAYFIENGKEHTAWFFGENDLVISIISFFTQRPSNEFIEAIEDCAVWSLSNTDLQYLYNHYPEFNYNGRVLTEKYYCQSEIRNYNIRMKTVSERYTFLQERLPDIINRIPLKYIASYLEIEPETLSRLRARK
jgi:CRP-like cAMP-binding protein